MRPVDELRRAAVDAAREARALLAELVARPGADGEIQANVPAVVAALFALEVGDAAKVLDGVEDAMSRLRAFQAATSADELSEERSGARVLPAHASGAERRAERQVAARLSSRALALLHPVRTSLARALGRERGDGTAPFLLTSARVKSTMPPARNPQDAARETLEGDADRRTTGRSELEVAVGFEGENTFFTGHTGDLSKGGLFVASDEPLSVGTELLLSFVLPDGHRVRADAHVAWVRAPRYRPDELPSGMGVRFVSLSSRDEHAIRHFLEVRPAFRYGD